MSKIALNSNASGTGVFTIASPNSNTDRTLTLPDASGTVVSENASGDVAVTGDITSNGNAVITTQSPQLGRRNLIINGAMQVAQRGTSFSGITSLYTYNTVDRSYFYISDGTTTVEQSSDAPEDFAKSFKVTYTTGSTIPAGSIHQYNHTIEAQDLTHLNYGTSAAKSVTVSFWMKSNVTGNRIVRLYRSSVSPARSIQAVVTQNVADTWEYKTVTFVGDVTGSMPFNSNEGMRVSIWYGAGSNFTSGTLSTVWEEYDATDNAAGIDSVGGTTNDYFAITGVQLEVGDVATPFEHRSYGEELALCQRYFYKAADQAVYSADYGGGSFTRIDFPVTMRATPTVTATNSKTVLGAYHSTQSIQFYLNANAGNMSPNATADAEL